MIVEQIYTGCLAQGAYYIESDGEAAIIDPLRETSPYIKKVERANARIKYVFETHFHADFVSGHVDLAAKTGAKIVFGPNAVCDFDAHIAKDGEAFTIGQCTMRVVHTPGHTLESTCYLLLDETGKERYLFTGDTLFIGDVGRPDLAQKTDVTMADLAAMLFDSLNTKIKTLPDDVIIYPAHGAGSACGKNMSKETFDTIGHQKQVNYALLAESKEQFVKEVLAGLTAPPAYFPQNVLMNRKGVASADAIMRRGLRPFNPTDFESAASLHKALVLDVRSDSEFANGHIPNSINIGLGGQFAPWVGELVVDINQPLLIVAPIGKEAETITRLSRVGYDNTIGYLDGGFEKWREEGNDIETINRINAATFAQKWSKDALVYDVRRESEYEAEHIEGASLHSLNRINEWMTTIDKNKHFYLHCAGGYRSMMAASILKARGYDNFTEVAGGFAAIVKTSIPKTNFTCQTTVGIKN